MTFALMGVFDEKLNHPVIISALSEFDDAVAELSGYTAPQGKNEMVETLICCYKELGYLPSDFVNYCRLHADPNQLIKIRKELPKEIESARSVPDAEGR